MDKSKDDIYDSNDYCCVCGRYIGESGYMYCDFCYDEIMTETHFTNKKRKRKIRYESNGMDCEEV